MKTKMINPTMALIIFFAGLNPAYGGAPIILSDAELDQISAGGLNFDFDALLGSANTISENMSKAPVSNPSAGDQGGIIVTPNSAIKVIAPVSPTAPATPTVPVSPTTPATPTAPAAPMTAISPTDPVSPIAPEPVAALSIEQNSIVTPIAPELPVSPTEPAGVSAPEPVRTLDLMATLGEKRQFEVLSNSTGASPVPLSTSGAINSVDLSGAAQQNLSAMVNVNAAGSIVPVQINLTVIMNSTVQNLSNSNSLQVNNYTTSRMR